MSNYDLLPAQMLLSQFERLNDGLEQQSKILNEILRKLEIASSGTGSSESQIQCLQQEVNKLRRSVELIQVAATQKTMDEVYSFYAENQQPAFQTLERLLEDGTSITRYGDGEIRLMFDTEYNLKFQKNSFEMREKLKEVLTTPVEGLQIALPLYARGQVWQHFWVEMWQSLKPFLRDDLVYGNSHISRPYVFQKFGQQAVELWRDIWAGKNLTIITGKGSRFDVIPELFDTAKSVNRIDSVPVNAFEDLDRLLTQVNLGNPDMFIIGLGPAGTVLAYELHKRGYRALDIGHLSSSYMNVYQGAKSPEQQSVSK